MCLHHRVVVDASGAAAAVGKTAPSTEQATVCFPPGQPDLEMSLMKPGVVGFIRFQPLPPTC